MHITMIGFEGAGKTGLLYRWKLGETITPIPTIGFNVESVQHQNVSFTIWDVDDQSRIRPLWPHYLQGTQGIIFVVDSVLDSLPEVRSKLQVALEEDELRNA